MQALIGLAVEKFGRHRLPVQQCRRPGADRRHRGPRGRPFRRRDGDPGAQRDARHEARRPPYAQPGFRQHHQQWQHRRTARRLFHVAGLWRGQGRRHPPHQMRGDGARRSRHPRQLDLAGRDRHRHFRQGAWHVGGGGGEDARADARGLQIGAADSARRPADRYRPCRGVSRQRRIQLSSMATIWWSTAPSPAATTGRQQQQGYVGLRETFEKSVG